MTPNEVISIAAATIGDSSFANLTKEEYITFLNNTANDLWMRSKAAQSIRQYETTAGERKLAISDRDIIAFHLIQVRKTDTPAGTDEADLYDPDEAPTYLREKSPQQDIEEGPSYYQDIGRTEDEYHIFPEFDNGVYTLHSSLPFAEGIVIQAYVYISRPRYSWQLIPAATTLRGQINPTDQEMIDAALQSNLIWEPMQNMFITGVLWRAAQQHRTYVKNPEINATCNDNKQLYFSYYLPEAIHFIHSLKDSTAGIQVRPFHYLTGGSSTRLY